MATKARTASASALDLGASLSGDVAYEFLVGNDPNPDVLLESLRASGYTLEAVVGDFIDNPIDAEASVILLTMDVNKKTGEWSLEIADNGSGMDEETLDQMMRLGSRTSHDLSRDLGAFGLGSDTAALAIGRRKHVVTAFDPDTWLSSMWDLDVIRHQKKFVKHMGAARESEMARFRAAFERVGLQVPEVGTLVTVSKGDRVGRKDLGSAVKAILKYVGQTYRRFLVPNGGLTIMVNGEKAVPIDPLWRDHNETSILLDDKFEFTWRDADGAEQTEMIGIVVAHLPDLGGIEANKAGGITIDKEGFYVLRNSREIVAGKTLGLFTRHNELSRFRCEVNFPAALDAQIGVSFLKSSADVKLSQGVRDKVDQVVAPYRRQSARLYGKSHKRADEQVPHEEASKLIKSRAPFLRRPQADIEKRGPRTDKGKPRSPKDQDSDRTQSPRERGQRALAELAVFEAKHLGVTAPFYEGSLDGRKIVVTYNADHPGYQRLILENRDNRGTITALDFLVYSLVAAELRNVDDNNARFMEAMREDASFNLRQLLTS